VFERKVPLVHEDSEATLGSIDLYKQGCFILEAKQASGEGTSKLGKAKRGTPAWNILMKDAYGQALGYARSFDRPPPFIIVCDIGHCFDLYAAFDGSGNYQPFPNAQNHRLFFSKLAEHQDILRKLFEKPLARWPATWPTWPRSWKTTATMPPWSRNSLCAACSPCSPRTWAFCPRACSPRRSKSSGCPIPKSSPARSNTCGAP